MQPINGRLCTKTLLQHDLLPDAASAGSPLWSFTSKQISAPSKSYNECGTGLHPTQADDCFVRSILTQAGLEMWRVETGRMLHHMLLQQPKDPNWQGPLDRDLGPCMTLLFAASDPQINNVLHPCMNKTGIWDKQQLVMFCMPGAHLVNGHDILCMQST